MPNKIKTETGANTNQILFMTQPYAAVGVVVANTGVTADSEGRKILKAGTPMYGSLEARTTAFVKASDTGEPAVSNAVGILVHDVDVTAGNENATLMVFGFVDLNKLDSTTAALITAPTKAALPKIGFIK